MAENANLYAACELAFAAHAHFELFKTVDGTTVSRAALLAQADQIAGMLAVAGVEPGDRVTVQAEKSITGVAVYLATLKIGAVFNPLNTAYTAAEVSFFSADATPKAMIAPAAKLGAITDVARQHGATALFSLEADGSGSLADAARHVKPFGSAKHRETCDLAALLYTSGTTGRSKGAMITHGNLKSNALALIDKLELRPGESMIHALPIYHVHGLFIALNAVLLGGMQMLWHEKFEARRVLADLNHAQVLMGIPTYYTRLLAEPGLDAQSCRSMRLFMSGSAPLLPETHTAFAARTGHTILERYGMTETGMK